MRRVLYWVYQLILTVVAVLGVSLALIVVAALIFNLSFPTFLSGSMSPTINTGALAVMREVPASELRSGDIVMTQTNKGTNVTHRVVSIKPLDGNSGNYAMVMRGDANPANDAEVYVIDKAERVLWWQNGLGTALTNLREDRRIFAGFAIAIAFLVYWSIAGNAPQKRTRQLSPAEGLDVNPTKTTQPPAEAIE